MNTEIIPRARASHPETSHEAAQSVTELNFKQECALITLQMHGDLTLEELVDCYHHHHVCKQSPSGIRTRCSELVKMGLVVDSGKRRLTRSRRLAIVWRAKA